jgi:hypothetical protein
MVNSVLELQVFVSKYWSSMKSKRIRWVGHVACMEQITNTYTISFGKLEGKEPTWKV